MYEPKPPAAWRDRPLSPAIRLSICAPRVFFCEISGIDGIIEGRRPTTPPAFPFFIGPRLGRLDGYGGNRLTRAFPRGAAWASAPGAWVGLPQFSRSSRAGHPDHLLIFPRLLPSPFPRASASPPAPGIPGGRPRQQATAAGRGGLLFPLGIWHSTL